MTDPNLDEHARRRLKAVGREIRKARGERTQQELGELLGDLPQTTVSRWEHGSVDFPLETIRRLEAALGLEDGHLLKAGGYVSKAAMPGTPIGSLSTDAIGSVKALIDAAELMEWGIQITNRVAPVTPGNRDAVVEFEVRIHDRIPGGA